MKVVTDEIVEAVAGEIHGEPPDDPDKMMTWEGRERKVREALESVEEDLIDAVTHRLLDNAETVAARQVIRAAATKAKED